ncbi:MAG TPA: DedA family protein [Gemmatimonadaceae bacterium]|jgi:membrane protein DedA with SNARE-associated domain|nr:DedA family protein [Gemmatimonadaceae bacterium]
MPDIAHHLAHLLRAYTYPVLVGLVMLESLGIPLPGEIALVTASAYASVGTISITAVIILAAVAATVGGVMGYWIGIKGGLPLLARYGGYVGVRRHHIDRAHGFFEKNGAKTILFGRFVAVLRTWASVVAGAACMSFRTFIAFNALGAFVWAIIFGLLGYYFGRDLPLLERLISSLSFVVLIVACLAILGLVWIKKRRNGKRPSGGEIGALGENKSEPSKVEGAR